MQKNHILCFCFLLSIWPTTAQSIRDYAWYRPDLSSSRLEGQGWSGIGYQRLPEKAREAVREVVWDLSKQTAGLGIRFRSDADSIRITYRVGGNHGMHHMPSTGVSGIDLYREEDGRWLWCRGETQFKDTIGYRFAMDTDQGKDADYHLSLPLYNTVEDLEIGIPKGRRFQWLPPREEPPIVVYGTSIAQGACASRPGMAWTHILSRKLDYPVINLGFSGNGRLEPEVIDLVNEIVAGIFVLDCLPNLPPFRGYAQKDVQTRIRESVLSLRRRHPNTPIVLVHHAGYSDGPVDARRRATYESLNAWTTACFEQLLREGVEDLHLLSKDDINLSNDATVDGTHPNDLGMEQYATAYAHKLRPLLPQGKN